MGDPVVFLIVRSPSLGLSSDTEKPTTDAPSAGYFCGAAVLPAHVTASPPDFAYTTTAPKVEPSKPIGTLIVVFAGTVWLK